jgi:hypothetical protein
MESLSITAGRRGKADIRREDVPPCHCTRRNTYGTPARDCACCAGCGSFAECESCAQETLSGEVYRITCGEHEYVACSTACAGALIAEALDSAAGIS